MGDAGPAIDNFISYLGDLQERVGAGVAGGWSLEQTLAAVPVPPRLGLRADFPSADAANAQPESLHRLNILATHRALEHTR